MNAVFFVLALVAAPASSLGWVPAVQIGDTVSANPRLVDQQGRTFAWNDLRGGAIALTFIYTRCRESAECPAISAKFAELQTRIPSGSRLIELTIDPTHDTPPVLKRYAAEFGADASRWTIATGNPSELLAFARRFNVNVAPAREPGQLIHDEAIAVFDAQGRLVSLTAGNTWQPQEILAELQSASGEHSNPLDRVTLWFRNFGVACGAVLGAADARSRTIEIAAALSMIALVASISIYLIRALRNI